MQGRHPFKIISTFIGHCTTQRCGATVEAILTDRANHLPCVSTVDLVLLNVSIIVLLLMRLQLPLNSMQNWKPRYTLQDDRPPGWPFKALAYDHLDNLTSPQ